MSSPICQSTELVADLRDEPVPITSPTRATGWPLSSSSLICSSASVTPSLGFLYIAWACRGISGRDQASCAGERSSVLVSPGTLNTMAVILSASSGLLVNHSASAQDCRTRCAWRCRLWLSRQHHGRRRTSAGYGTVIGSGRGQCF